MKVVFLDFDGVLVNRDSLRAHSGTESCAAPSCVEALNKITAATGAQIVVSSTWRIGRSLPDLRQILKAWGVMAPVLARTPHMGFTIKRGSEIKAWLDMYESAREEVDSFVILDDDSDMEPLMDFLVQTNFDDGLAEIHVEKAIELLRIPLRQNT